MHNFESPTINNPHSNRMRLTVFQFSRVWRRGEWYISQWHQHQLLRVVLLFSFSAEAVLCESISTFLLYRNYKWMILVLLTTIKISHSYVIIYYCFNNEPPFTGSWVIYPLFVTPYMEKRSLAFEEIVKRISDCRVVDDYIASDQQTCPSGSTLLQIIVPSILSRLS